MDVTALKEGETDSVESRRIYVGGLFPDVKASDLTEKFARFGSVDDVQIKIRKNEQGESLKTFAHLNINSSQRDLNRCFSTFTNAKWKGSVMFLQVAKENFLSKLEKERNEVSETPTSEVGVVSPTLHDPFIDAPTVENFMMKGAVPGTPIPGENNWVVGKYGRVLPIVHLKKSATNRMVRVDPSKLCHNLKKLKDDNVENNSTDALIWDITDKDTEITRKRKGDFPESRSKSKLVKQNGGTEKVFKILADQKFQLEKRREENKFEIVCQGKTVDPATSSWSKFVSGKVKKSPLGSGKSELTDSEAGTADTDEIIAATKTASKKKKQSERRPSKDFQKRTETFSDTDSDSESGDVGASFVYIPADGSHGNQGQSSDSSSELSDSVEEFQKTNSKRNKNENVSLVNVVKTPASRKKAKESRNGITESPKSAKLSKKSIAMKLSFDESRNRQSSSEESSSVSDETSSESNTDEVMPEHNKSSKKSSKDETSSVSDETSSESNTEEVIPEHKKPDKSSLLVPKKSSNKKTKQEIEKDTKKDDLQKKVARTYSRGIPEFKGRSVVDEEQNDTKISVQSSTMARKCIEDRVISNSAKAASTKMDSKSNKSETKAKKSMVSSTCKKTKETVKNSNSSSDSEDTDDVVPKANLDKKSQIKSKSSTKISESLVSKRKHSEDESTSSDDTDEILSSSKKTKILSRPGIKSKLTASKSSMGSLMLDEYSCGFSVQDNEIVFAPSHGRKHDESESEDSDYFQPPPKKSKSKHEEPSKNTQDEKCKENDAKDSKSQLKNQQLSKTVSKKELSSLDKQSRGKSVSEMPLKESLSSARSNARRSEMSSLDKHADDNRRRLETLHERKKEIESKKAVLQQALSKVDSGKRLNKKIVFDSDSDEDVIVTPASKKAVVSDARLVSLADKNTDKKALALFDSAESDDTDDENRFRIRPQYEGEGGKRLMKIQSRIGNDERFRMDEKFAESDDEHQEKTVPVDEPEEESERSRTLRILESVVGRQPVARLLKYERDKKTFKDMTSMQYDPTRDDHSRFEIEVAPKEKTLKKKDKKKRKAEAEAAAEPLPEVSKERHYEVSSALQDAFAAPAPETTATSAGFSLLATFGKKSTSDVEEDMEAQTGNTSTQITTSGAAMNPWQSRFSHDTDDSSDDGGEAHSASKATPPGKNTVMFPARKLTFFFVDDDDERLEEGVKYFRRPEDFEAVIKNWRRERPRLVESYKEKFRKAARNQRKLNLQKFPNRKFVRRTPARKGRDDV